MSAGEVLKIPTRTIDGIQEEVQMKHQTTRKDFLKISAAACAAPITALGGVESLSAPPEGNAAKLPSSDPLTWGKEPLEAQTSRRATICLNGIWQAMPAVGDSRRPPSAQWGYIRVPGSWQEGENRIPGWVAKGTGRPWEDFRGDAVSCLWYQRPINVPADWGGRAVLLEFKRVSTEARVYVNDQACGDVRWPEGTVDITRAITPGKEATVRL